MNLPGFTGEAALDKTGGKYRLATIPNGVSGRRGVLAQLAQDTYTTAAVCKACGCTVSGFACNCGLRPDPHKLDCIRNGGPSRTLQGFTAVDAGAGAFQWR